MVKGTPAEIAEKWKRRATAASVDYKKGIERVTESPTEKAANKADKMRANLIKALDEGKWEKALRSVSLEEWKRMASTKGASNYATGITASEGKMAEFMSEVLPHIESGQRAIQAMPDITIEDSKARVVAWIDHMHKFKRSRYK